MKSPWFRVVYVPLLGAFTGFMLFLFAFGAVVCLSILVINLTLFVVPFWFGERRPRRLVVNGLLALLIAFLLLGALRTNLVLSIEPLSVQSFPGPGQDNTISLTNGTVTPFHSDVPEVFRFRVTLTSTDGNATPDAFDVRLNLTIVEGVSLRFENVTMVHNVSSGTDLQNGVSYENDTPLFGSIYGYGFEAHQAGGANWTKTTVLVGPIAASPGTWYVYNLLVASFTMVISVVFYLTIVFLWWYMGRMRRTRGEIMERVRERTKDTSSVAGGKATKATAFTCTNCGADVTEDASSCPKCGALFED
jgi:hypothetical protein